MNPGTTDYTNKLQKCNDHRSFTEFYHKYQAFVYYTAIRFKLCHHSAKDVQQEVFLQLWRHKETIDPVENVLSYIFIATRNCCINIINKRKRHTGIAIIDLDENELEFVDPLKAIEARHVYNKVKRTANKILPKQCKLVYQLAVENDVFYLDIAKYMGTTPSTVKNQKVRAIRLIKEVMGSETEFASYN